MRTRNALALTTSAALIVPAVISGSAAAASAETAAAAVTARTSSHGPVPVASDVARALPVEDRPGDRPADRPADRAPTCGKPSDPDFPITTRVHGGPDTVRAGSGFHSWSIDLRNGTRENCDRIHPVLVLTARERGFAADRVTLEFHDERADRWRPVTLEATTRDELVGAFDDGFQGFVVPAGETVTVRTRLSIAAGTAANTITVNAAVVQRDGDDGDWVGESGDYRFAVVAGGGAEPDAPTPARSTPARSTPAAESPAAESPAATEPAEQPRPSSSEQLATTGSGALARIGVGAAVIVMSAGLLVFVARRLRPGPGRR
ncbi:hypothetical protein [Streptomyces sp. NPDC003023]|uniref:hypothetical protein n=1 Tax=Streptomyces sp. NPDC003023 TaxID=3364675 RepID=UPI0036961DB0